MIQFDFEHLRSLGLTFALAQKAALISSSAETCGRNAERHLMRLDEVHRDSLRLHNGARTHHALATTKLSRCLASDSTELAVVSNVDTALLVMGLDDDFNLRRLERWIALVRGTGVVSVIVLMKADLIMDRRSLYERQQAVHERIASEWEIFCVDTRDADIAEPPRHLAVPSGERWFNAASAGHRPIAAGHRLSQVARRPRHAHHRTLAVSVAQRGLHHRYAGPARPAADVDATAVAATFADIATLAPQCRFRNCAHASKPGGVVREGVDADRLINHQKLLREARRDTMSVFERQQPVAAWKVRGRAGTARAQSKPALRPLPWGKV